MATLAKAGNRRPRLVVGFAAETEDVLTKALVKIDGKNCDWLLANKVGFHEAFDQDDNQITFLQRGTPEPEAWPRQSKQQIAEQLVDRIILKFKTA